MRRAQGDGTCGREFRLKCSSHNQQAQRPDGPAMGIHAVGGGEHRLLALSTDQPDGLTQRQTDLADLSMATSAISL